ncbi:hypothetical protein FLAG1_07619 [Fusarium langsethiae]|uniref:Uncharacterized protein n=1 Tax=Fusarium langsethiae TaxID=179993 RepID=A0A0M9ETT4_FUSLA|nr:hypothetical protein FLAG1_07619 [Fusarium langsethiae]GKU05046.1 unnamed protein product [Fusarium langsethiae]GKU19375.1 unnamed protein product [Fusarium langsethiae]
MCERNIKKYVCSRCRNFIFVGEPEKTECKWRRWGKRCGHLDQIDIIKCEADLCTRCSSFPADSPLPFIGTPDLAPKSDHDVERRCKAVLNNKKQEDTVRAPALLKARKTYLAGEADPGQAKRDAALNRMLYRRLTRPLELMKMKEPRGLQGARERIRRDQGAQGKI